MIFARYIGAEKGFTTGKVYPAKPEVESSDAVRFGFIELTNDAGEKVRVRPRVEMVEQPDGRAIWADRYDFEFLEEVYAVVVTPFDDLKKGQVVVVDEMETFEGTKNDGGTWGRLVFGVKGVGFRSSDGLVLLDRTNVFPGLVVLEEGTGKWVRIKSVDECLWVVTEDRPERRSPEEFLFSVDKDGDLQVEPLVECVDDTGGGELGIVKGKHYRLLRQEMEVRDGNYMVWIVNDLGQETGYLASRFRV